MCVIIIKEKNETLPRKEILENCFDRNSHGAGFMYVESGRVVIDKGYMDFDSFYSHYKELCVKFNDFNNKNLVIHMRIATSGGIERENTHPFPLTDDYEEMKELYFKTDVGIAHNGRIFDFEPSKEQEEQKISDTMLFIKTYLNSIYHDWNGCFENAAFIAGISSITSSRLAILDKNDTLRLVGDFKEFENNRYSNTSYEKAVDRKQSYYYNDYYESLYVQCYRDYEGFEF